MYGIQPWDLGRLTMAQFRRYIEWGKPDGGK
jgi:hypothetical protein